MNHAPDTTAPAAVTGMLVRRPPADVFRAFVDPEVTTRFWFTRSSGPLEEGREVEWTWEMYGISVPVTARVVETDRRLVVEMPGEDGPTRVEWTFAPTPDGHTFVRIAHTGFTCRGDDLVKQVSDSVEGFALVLAGLKALLEHGVALNLVADRFPAGIEQS